MSKLIWCPLHITAYVVMWWRNQEAITGVITWHHLVMRAPLPSGGDGTRWTYAGFFFIMAYIMFFHRKTNCIRLHWSDTCNHNTDILTYGSFFGKPSFCWLFIYGPGLSCRLMISLFHAQCPIPVWTWCFRYLAHTWLTFLSQPPICYKGWERGQPIAQCVRTGCVICRKENVLQRISFGFI